MTRPRPKLKPVALHRPTAETLFYVDYEWWTKENLDIKTYIYSRLAVSDEVSFDLDIDEVDLIDMRTGEVRKVDGFQYALQSYFRQLPDDFVAQTSLVDAVFCVLLGNANQPMTAIEIAEKLGRDPNVIVRTVGGPRIYQGIRPIFDED